MSEVLFTHRPLAGVSVGALNKNGVLYVAFALTNDGTSRKHYFYPERRDNFSRNKARSILTGRIERMVETNAPVHLGMMLLTDMEARKFVEAFRKTFKPVENESDNFLIEETGVFESDFQPVRARLSPQVIIERLTGLASSIITSTVNA